MFPGKVGVRLFRWEGRGRSIWEEGMKGREEGMKGRKEALGLIAGWRPSGPG